MYARVTPFELDTVRRPLDEAIDYFDANVLPELRDQAGYEGLFVLANPDGRGLVVTLWTDRDDADEGVRTGFYAAQLDKFVTVFRAPPGREGYDVVRTDELAFAPD